MSRIGYFGDFSRRCFYVEVEVRGMVELVGRAGRLRF